MRRATLITIIALLVAIVGMAVYQLATGVERRSPGPGSRPAATTPPR